MRERNALAIPGLVMVVVLIALFCLPGCGCSSRASGRATTACPRSRPDRRVLVSARRGDRAPRASSSSSPTSRRSSRSSARTSGTVHTSGFTWTWPLTIRRIVSLRVQNFDSQILKVNDAVGNPVEVAAVVVWRVVDTAKAVFDVEDYEEFVKIQTETAVRHMASLLSVRQLRGGRLVTARECRAVTDRSTASSRSTSRLPAWRSSERSCGGSPTRRRSPATCSGASRRRRSSPPGRGSSKVPSAWSTWRSTMLQREGHRRARRGAQGRDGVEPARRPLRRDARPADRQHRNALLAAPWRNARASCCASARSSTRSSSAGQPTSCAARTPRSSTCSSMLCDEQVVIRGHRRRLAERRAGSA